MELILILLILLTGCQNSPPIDSPPWVGEYKNACLPEAIVMSEGLKKVGIEAKVLRISTPKWNHAVCVYTYKGKTWVWDSYWKSISVLASMDRPDLVAQNWVYYTSRGMEVREAKYIE